MDLSFPTAGSFSSGFSGTQPVTAGRYLDVFKNKNDGVFSFKTPQQKLEYIKNLQKQGYDKADIAEAMASFPQPSQDQGFEQEIKGPIADLIRQQAFNASPAGMKMQLEMAREDAREKAKQQAMWSTLAKLPESIASAVNPFGGPAGAAMYYQGMSAIPNIYNQTLASYPQLQVPGASTQQFRYFN